MSDTNLTFHEINHPLSMLISELIERVEFHKLDATDAGELYRLKQLSVNALFSLTTWSEAVGSLASMASTHPDADKETILNLGVTSEMLGLMSHLGETLSVLKDDANHVIKANKNSLTNDNMKTEQTVH